MITPSPIRAGLAVLALFPLAGCATGSIGETDLQPTAHANLRPIMTRKDAAPADRERALLARFIGAWNFQGWSAGPDGAHSQIKGVAAAVIEDDHFVHIDLQSSEGSLRAGKNASALMLASEPGIGLTMTVWGDASPSISRLTGSAEPDGSVFRFAEVRTPSGIPRARVTITFESDDRWAAEISEQDGKSPLAAYTFTRKTP
jgi:hypothetical protein